MRTFVATPKAEGEYPGVWCYSDIFQLTPPLLRFCVRLAGYGFVPLPRKSIAASNRLER
jgi:carboxymethylenebutenolidase